MEQRKNRFQWTTLDNAAKVFPALADEKDSRVFRFCCQLKEEIDKNCLQRAVDQTLEEFPSFTNIIRHGMFWYYQEESDQMPVVHQEDRPVCSRLYDKNVHHLLIDISYYKSRINLEIFHAVTDGTGAMMFLKTLVVNYLRLRHPEELSQKEIALGFDSTLKEKVSDSFDQYYEKPDKKEVDAMPFMGKGSVYTFREPVSAGCRQLVTEGRVSAKKIVGEAKRRGTTVSVFLTALLILSIYDAMEPKERKKAVRIMVPVNLRSYFESNTVRNFFGTFPVTYDREKQGGELEEAISAVSKTFQEELTKKKMSELLAGQVGLEKRMAARLVPLIIKDIAMYISSRIAGKRQTMYFSNLGRIAMPEEVKDYVELFDVFISSAARQVCMCSYEDEMVITFAGVLKPRDTERAFFRRLSQYDPDMVISTNYSGRGMSV